MRQMRTGVCVPLRSRPLRPVRLNCLFPRKYGPVMHTQDAVSSAKTSTELQELASRGNSSSSSGSVTAAGSGMGAAQDGLLSGGGDEFMAVKPWLGALVPPHSAAAQSSSSSSSGVEASTDVDLTLQWVHGYRAHGT
jgi:hypothetical protein